MTKFGMSLFAGVIMAGVVACDDGVADKTQNAVICEEVCKRVGSCVGTDDTSACRKDCESKSENDQWEQMAKDCRDCVDRGDSCVNKTLECGTECAGVAAVAATN